MEFFEHLATALGSADLSSFLVGTILSATRIYVIVRMLPPLGGGGFPALPRVVLAVVLALVMGGGDGPSQMPSPAMVVLLLLKEALVGLTIGTVASLPFYFAQQAGFLADVSRGGVTPQEVAPLGDDSTTPLGNLFLLFCIVLFFLSPVGDLFWTILKGTFRVAPLYPPASIVFRPERMVETVTATAAGLFLASVMIAMPVMAIVFLADILTGMLERFSSFGGGYFVAMPFRALAGLAGVVILLGFLPRLLQEMMNLAFGALLHLYR